MTHTLNDCGCTAKVYSDGSGVDIEFCEMHLNAPARAEAAEARVNELKAQLESITTVDLHNAMQQRDELLQEARDSATLIMALRQERDETRRQLTEAQHAIGVLSNTVVAQDAEIKRLSQQREDVEQYRAEIARLNQAAA